MYILSVTFVVEPAAQSNFRVYLRDEIKPMVDGYEIKWCRVLSEKHEGHFTYSLQIELESLANYNMLKDSVQSSLLKYNFGEMVLHFTTLLKQEEICL